MTRTFNSPISDQRGEFTYLYEIHSSNAGTPEILRLTNSNADITALTFTWTAVGAMLGHSAANETRDQKAQGVELSLYGLDQTIIAQIQNNQFRGQLIVIYLLHFDPDTGVQDTPDLVFQGRQNGDYRVTETRDPENMETGGLVTVTTRISADLSQVNTKVSTRTNVHSHEEMLRRSGVVSPDDKFFNRVLSLVNKEIFWGTDAPYTGGNLGGGVGGNGGQDDRNGEDVWW